MEFLNNIELGFSVATTANNLIYCFIGVVLGTMVGMLPGIGTVGAISILLPLVYQMGDPLAAIILLTGLYYGTQYGGSITSILLNIPGEPSTAATCISGHLMAKKGKAGVALTIAALGSFFAGTISTIFIIFLSEYLSNVSFMFGPTEYTAIMLVGLVAAVSVSQNSYLKGAAMVLIGLLLGLIGADVNSGVARFTFDLPELYNGINFVIVAMGVFGLGEIFYNYFHLELSELITPNLKKLYPSKEDMKKSLIPIIRGTALGSILGILPGGGTIISSFASYSIEKYFSKNPAEFKQGAIAGVAGPESANNAAAQTSLIPMLSLGLPFTPVMALILSVLLVNGINPGPQMIKNQPELFWGLIASMYIGNLFLLILNVPLVGVWVQVLKTPKKILYLVVIFLCMFVSYFINNSWFDVFLLFVFAMAGYIFRLLRCEPAPMAMGFVIGNLFEEYLRRSLTINRGDWLIFFKNPISLTLIISLVIIFFLHAVIKDNYSKGDHK